MKRLGWEIVEDKISPSGDASAALFRKRVVNNTVYRFVSWKGSEKDSEKHLYSTDDAFNALEAWEVKVGILPASYNPKLI